MNHIEIRYAILQDLYDQAVQRGRMSGQISPELQKLLESNAIADNIYNFNLRYLEGKGFIKARWYDTGHAIGLSITSSGCDMVEFYKLGMSMEDTGNGPRFDSLLKHIADSGIKVFEGSAVGLVNLALSHFLG